MPRSTSFVPPRSVNIGLCNRPASSMARSRGSRGTPSTRPATASTDSCSKRSGIVAEIEDEPPDGQPLLGLYRGVPLPRRSSTYSGVLPDKISIFRGPITRLAAGDADRVRREVRHVVLHEIAHHFGISDARLIELDRY